MQGEEERNIYIEALTCINKTAKVDNIFILKSVMYSV